VERLKSLLIIIMRTPSFVEKTVSQTRALPPGWLPCSDRRLSSHVGKSDLGAVTLVLSKVNLNSQQHLEVMETCF